MKKILDYLPITSDGIFTAFTNPVWAIPFSDTAELDQYFALRYGERIGNKLLEFYAAADGTVKGEQLTALASMVYNINARKWEHLYGVYQADYNPIENTDFIETIKDKTDNTRQLTGTTTNSGTATTNSNGTSTGSSSGDNNVYGFNSATAVGDTTTNGSNTDTTTASSTSTSSSSVTDNNTVTDDGTHESEHRKHGNIGVVEATTMLEHEVRFWKWSFIDQVCQDICDIIALSIY